MTKAEELKLLEKIDALVKSADAGDYIPMTFAGIVEVCKRNIEDDFGDSPVEDCANMRFALDAERRMHDETKRMLAEAQNMCKEAMEETIEWKNKYSDSVEHYENIIAENNGKMAEMRRDIAGSEDCIKDLRNEIIRLKAEIYDWERA